MPLEHFSLLNSLQYSSGAVTLMQTFFSHGYKQPCFRQRPAGRSLSWTALLSISELTSIQSLNAKVIPSSFYLPTAQTSIQLRKNGLRPRLHDENSVVLPMNFFYVPIYDELYWSCYKNEMRKGESLYDIC